MNVRPCLHLLTATLLAFSVTSCATWKKHFGKDTGQEYAAADGTGGYNPYPGSSGTPSYQQPYSSAPQQQQYPQYQTYTPQQQQQQQQQTPPQQGNYAPQPDYTPSPDYSEPAPTPSRPKKKSSGGGGGGGSYTVKQGDTLYRIALKNGTTVSKLKSSNGLTSDLIRPGQTLSIP